MGQFLGEVPLPAVPPLVEDLPELANRRLLRRIVDEIALLSRIGDDVEKRIPFQIATRRLLPVRDDELVTALPDPAIGDVPPRLVEGRGIPRIDLTKDRPIPLRIA